jgi:hypothetical protein
MQYEIEDKPASKNAWFTPAESNSYYRERYARTGITVHWWGGGEQETAHDSIVNYFLKQSQAGVKSVNYVVSDAKITKMVDPDNVAWCSNGGNPTTISIEFEPGLSDEGYRRGAWLISCLEKLYGHTMKFYKHSDWVPTSCPGSIDLERLRHEANGVSGDALPAQAPAQQASSHVTPTPSAGSQTVRLPASVSSWAAYKVGSQYRKGTSDQVGKLSPSKFGGLTYEIVQNLGNVVVIDTQSFGRVAIWVSGTDAVVSSAATYAQPVAPSAPGQTVTFPAYVQSWAVYTPDSGYRKGTTDQVGSILPAMFGGLTYPVVENKGNVVIIDTKSFGRVAAWVQGTDALIR